MSEKENDYISEIFEPIKEQLDKKLGPVQCRAYIETLTPVAVEGKHIVLRAPSEHIRDYINGRIGEDVRDAIIQADVGLSDFRIVLEGEELAPWGENGNENEDEYSTANLDPRFTFEGFVVGKCNEFVYNAAMDVANNPAGNYNPLFIYGGTGLGKTHLIQAVAHRVRDTRPELKVIYVTCEQFFNEIIDTMFTSKGPDSREKGNRLRRHYRSTDVLIIDDIQFIANKKAVQEEFFHMFNELVANGKQIVISSDQPPQDLPLLDDRLRTRFLGGLLCDVTPPDYETKIAILKRKSLEKKMVVPDDVLAFLAQDSGVDVRTLEGRLTKVIFASKLHEEPITLQLATDALNEAVSETSEDVTPRAIINAVCQFYGIKEEDLIGKSKKKEIVMPRQVCCYLMCELLSLPLVTIGKELGGRDHTTIIYARDKVEEMCKVSDRLSSQVEDIKSMVLKK